MKNILKSPFRGIIGAFLVVLLYFAIGHWYGEIKTIHDATIFLVLFGISVSVVSFFLCGNPKHHDDGASFFMWAVSLAIIGIFILLNMLASVLFFIYPAPISAFVISIAIILLEDCLFLLSGALAIPRQKK